MGASSAVAGSQSKARMPSGVLLLTKTRWRLRFANEGEASAGAADVASVAEEAVFRKSRRVNLSIMDTIVADGGIGGPAARQCAKVSTQAVASEKRAVGPTAGGYSFHGSSNFTAMPRTSRTFRVTRVNPCTTAVAASRVSTTGLGRSLDQSPHSRAVAASTPRMRSAKLYSNPSTDRKSTR